MLLEVLLWEITTADAEHYRLYIQSAAQGRERHTFFDPEFPELLFPFSRLLSQVFGHHSDVGEHIQNQAHCAQSVYNESI